MKLLYWCFSVQEKKSRLTLCGAPHAIIRQSPHVAAKQLCVVLLHSRCGRAATAATAARVGRKRRTATLLVVVSAPR